ncbi:MAG TPA: GNAT family N-acetyltransferase [Candidatus Angelobacter sp.]|nr:GNAT family N-acetyltransferase [Candidatus Angelobacter sp.]
MNESALAFAFATAKDAAEISALHNAAAERLTRDHGPGHWSSLGTERGVLNNLRKPKFSRILVGRSGRKIVATLRLATKKPWAIDTAYFTFVKRPVYLVGMAVHPLAQGNGFGRRILQEAIAVAKDWPTDAIRLDAYDAPAGAGPFYAKCGFCEVGRVSYRNTPHIYYEMVF